MVAMSTRKLPLLHTHGSFHFLGNSQERTDTQELRQHYVVHKDCGDKYQYIFHIFLFLKGYAFSSGLQSQWVSQYDESTWSQYEISIPVIFRHMMAMLNNLPVPRNSMYTTQQSQGNGKSKSHTQNRRRKKTRVILSCKCPQHDPAKYSLPQSTE